MTQFVVIFFMMMSLPTSPRPIEYNEQVESIQECLELTYQVLSIASPSMNDNGGSIRAGCLVKQPPSVQQ